MTSAARQFEMATSETENGIAITAQGDLDVATAPILLEGFKTAFAKGAQEVVLDASGLDFVDSAGLSLLVTVHKRAEAEGKSLVIRSPKQQLSRLLELTDLAGYFHVTGS